MTIIQEDKTVTLFILIGVFAIITLILGSYLIERINYHATIDTEVPKKCQAYCSQARMNFSKTIGTECYCNTTQGLQSKTTIII